MLGTQFSGSAKQSKRGRPGAEYLPDELLGFQLGIIFIVLLALALFFLRVDRSSLTSSSPQAMYGMFTLRLHAVLLCIAVLAYCYEPLGRRGLVFLQPLWREVYTPIAVAGTCGSLAALVIHFGRW